MECMELVTNCDNYCGDRFIRKRRKLSSLDGLYAGLIVCLVPSVVGVSDWSRHLTYDKIFNDTNYVQINHQPRPYNLPNAPYTYNYTNGFRSSDRDNYLEDAKENELEYEEFDYRQLDNYNNKEQLLVGFAHDPFRYSVPEADYRKGVRNINPQSYERGENRGKRGVLHLYNMMYCATGCEPLAYKGYGCYCGFLGAGRPTDGIDRCCKMHDQCYEGIFCPFYTVYFQPYYWKCHRGEPLCALENYSSQHQVVNGCAARLCECDRRFAMCVRQYPCPRRRALCRSSPLRLLQNLLMFR